MSYEFEIHKVHMKVSTSDGFYESFRSDLKKYAPHIPEDRYNTNEALAELIEEARVEARDTLGMRSDEFGLITVAETESKLGSFMNHYESYLPEYEKIARRERHLTRERPVEMYHEDWADDSFYRIYSDTLWHRVRCVSLPLMPGPMFDREDLANSKGVDSNVCNESIIGIIFSSAIGGVIGAAICWLGLGLAGIVLGILLSIFMFLGVVVIGVILDILFSVDILWLLEYTPVDAMKWAETWYVTPETFKVMVVICIACALYSSVSRYKTWIDDPDWSYFKKANANYKMLNAAGEIKGYTDALKKLILDEGVTCDSAEDNVYHYVPTDMDSLSEDQRRIFEECETEYSKIKVQMVAFAEVEKLQKTLIKEGKLKEFSMLDHAKSSPFVDALKDQFAS